MTTYTLNDGSLLCWAVFTLDPGTPDRTPVRVGLRWDPNYPLAVTMEFIARDTMPVTWVLSRDALADGMTFPAGLSDYQVFPVANPTCVGLHLESLSGTATFSMSAEVLRSFLAMSYNRCPRGAEYAGYDVDSELAELIAEEGAA